MSLLPSDHDVRFAHESLTGLTVLLVVLVGACALALFC